MNTVVKSLVFATALSLSSFAAAIPFYEFVGGEQTGNGMSVRAGHPGHLEIVESGEYHFQSLHDDPTARTGPFLSLAEGEYQLFGAWGVHSAVTSSPGWGLDSLVLAIDAGTDILAQARSTFNVFYNTWMVGDTFTASPFLPISEVEWLVTAMDDGGLLNQFYWNGSSNADPDWVFTISKVNTTNVPEPGTLVLMSLGLFILGVGPKRLNPEYIDPGST